jgi:predicted secreted Zn-dependent protease
MIVSLLLALLIVVQAADDAPASSPLEPIIISEPGFEVVVRREFYGVTGRSYRDANNAVMTRQVMVGGAASAQASISFTYNVFMQNGACVLRDTFVAGDIVLTFPVWVEYESRSRSDRNRWSEFFETMQVHENYHAEITIQSVERMLAALNDIEPAEDCAQMRDRVEVTSDAVHDWLQRNQREYDRVTRHGIEQDNVDGWQPHDGAVGRRPVAD